MPLAAADDAIARAEKYLAQGQPQAALATCDDALCRHTPDPSVLRLRGLALLRLGRPDQAVTSFDAALLLRAEDPDAHFNRAVALKALHRPAEALAAYDMVLALRTDHPQALNGRGNVLLQLDRPAEAILSFDRAAAVKPDYVAAEHNLANALRRFGNPGVALERFERAYALAPQRDYLLGDLILARRQVCDWRQAGAEVAALAGAVAKGERACTPFVSLAVLDSPALQRKAAETYACDRHPAQPVDRPVRPPSAGAAIRLGYFSADFHRHPVAYLTAELFELHDRERFEVFAFSLSPPLADPMRQRLVAAFDHFVDVSGIGDADAARRARELGIDIAIDLGGYTENSRTGIFACRAAPVQAGYLGYLGSMGAPYYDYLLADEIIVPPAACLHYSERIAWLPSYQANDSRRRIGDARPSRADEGLPERGFVYCCFNNSYKITPEVFAAWMRILDVVPHSVLWLFAADPLVANNLRREAAGHDVDPARLVFAPRREHADYLARYRLADLFLDTLPYNAGTTASDALWAGVPVLTRCGESFAGRVAASLLHAVGLPELVTGDTPSYIELAVALATDAPRMQALRRTLADARAGSALFDSPRFTRTLESAYLTMHRRHLAGLPPENIHA